MKALTLQAPWGWAITTAGKNIENRTWPPRVPPGTLIAIHAGKTLDDGARHHPAMRHAMQAVEGETDPWLIPGVIGVATVFGAHAAGAACTPACATWGMPQDDEARTWHWQILGWPLATPVPCRGALGLWTLPEDVEAAVRRQLDLEGGEHR